MTCALERFTARGVQLADGSSLPPPQHLGGSGAVAPPARQCWNRLRARVRTSTNEDEEYSDTNLAVMTTTGSEIECDVVVTATGLKLVQSPGNIEISVDGTPMKLREHVTYRGAM